MATCFFLFVCFLFFFLALDVVLMDILSSDSLITWKQNLRSPQGGAPTYVFLLNSCQIQLTLPCTEKSKKKFSFSRVENIYRPRNVALHVWLKLKSYRVRPFLTWISQLIQNEHFIKKISMFFSFLIIKLSITAKNSKDS